MMSQSISCSRTTKILISYCFLLHFWAVGTSGKTVFLTLFHFLSWAIFKNHWFSFGFPMFFAHTWSSFSWSLKSFFGLLISYCFLRHFWAVGTFGVIFSSRTTKNIDFILFFTAFLNRGHLWTNCLPGDFFTFSRERFLNIIGFPLGFPMFFAHTWFSFSWSLKSFFSHARRKSWFHIVFYSIFEPRAPVGKRFFYDIFTFSRERFLIIIGFP